MPYNPYDRGNPIEAGLRSASAVIGIQDRQQAQKDRAEDRSYQRTLRGREDAAYQREQQLQAPIEEEIGLRKAERAGRMATAQAVPEQVAHQERQRIYTESGWLTPQQQERMKALGIDQAETSLDASKQSIAASKENIAAARETRQTAKENKLNVRRTLEQYNTAMQKVGALKDEPTANAVMDTFTAVRNKDGATLEKLWPTVMPALGRIIADDVEQGVGDTIEETGETITGKRLADVRMVGDKAVLEFEVTAQDKNGKKRTYFAPPTEGRGTDPKARVLTIPMAQLEDWLQEAAAHAIDVQEGKLTEDTVRESTRQALVSSGMDAKDVDAMIGPAKGDAKEAGAMGKDLDYLAREFTDGDKTKAVELYKQLRSASAKPRNERFDLVKSVMQGTGRTPTQQEVDALMKMATDPAAAAGGPAAGATGGESADVDDDLSDSDLAELEDLRRAQAGN